MKEGRKELTPGEFIDCMNHGNRFLLVGKAGAGRWWTLESVGGRCELSTELTLLYLKGWGKSP